MISFNNNWIKCIAVISFDIDYGQVIDRIFPDKNVIDEQE